MKKTLSAIIFLLFAAGAIPLSAQNVKFYYKDPNKKKFESKNIFRDYPRNEISFGIGLGNINGDKVRYGDIYDNYYYSWYSSIYPGERFEDSHYYEDLTRSTYAFNGRYFYTISPVIQIGAILSYYQASANRYHTTTREFDSRSMSHYASIIPEVRINYYKSRRFSIYSAIGIGYGQYYRRDFGEDSYKHGAFLAGDFTALGVTFGHKIFVNAEIVGITAGMFKLYIGYRF